MVRAQREAKIPLTTLREKNLMDQTALIKEKALELGFAAVGVTSAEPFYLYATELNERGEMYAWGNTLSQKTSVRDLDLTKFIDPANFLPQVKSIIVVTDSYLEEEIPQSLKGKIGRCYLKGLFCPEESAHRQRRKEFKKFLQSLGLKTIYGPAPARLAGARAGITNFGKNCFAFANEVAGKSSWIVNEPYLVDRELKYDEPTLRVNCPENCQLCFQACPTGALYAPLKMDPRQCIAYHTYFNDGEIPLEIREKMGTWVYGCDICQEVCPRNKKWLEKNKPLDEKLMKRAKDFDLITLLTMSPEHFQQKVWPLLYYIRQDKSYLWQRNAAVALGNEKNPEAIPHLLAVLENPEPLVRMHVAWALGKIGGRQAKSALENREKFEPNEKVRQEIKFALSRI